VEDVKRKKSAALPPDVERDATWSIYWQKHGSPKTEEECELFWNNPPSPPPSIEAWKANLAELAQRYFEAHGLPPIWTPKPPRTVGAVAGRNMMTGQGWVKRY
jgi:hypothetical protein